MKTVELTTFTITLDVDGPVRSNQKVKTTDVREAAAEFKGFVQDFTEKGFTIEKETQDCVTLTDGKEDDGTTVTVCWNEETEDVDAAELDPRDCKDDDC